MPFNSFPFLIFLGLTVGAYYLAPQRVRWALLLLASLYFYSAFQVAYLALLVYAIAVAYCGGIIVAQRRGTRAGRVALGGAIAAELGVLVLFKYVDFIAATLEPLLRGVAWLTPELALPRLGFLLPAGLSFFTFSSISYLVDVWRGTLPVERHPGHLALYVAFFPKLLAGPIERAKPFIEQLRAPKRFDPDALAAGLMLLLWGLFKKVVIADRLAEFVDPAFTTVAVQSPVALTIAVYLYAFQIYCDFSGYSDMAIGAARLFGIGLMENFRRPYLSRSVAEFWAQRWHISLSLWLRDYLYIPLGGSRVGPLRRAFNLLLVFTLSGLWHGASWGFVVWGALNGLLQVAHVTLAHRFRDRVARVPEVALRPLEILVTFHLILLTWVFFRAATVSDALTVLRRITGALPQFPTLLANYNWTPELLGSFALIALLLAVEIVDERRPIEQRLKRAPTALRWGLCHAQIVALLVIGRWGGSQFVYMQF